MNKIEGSLLEIIEFDPKVDSLESLDKVMRYSYQQNRQFFDQDVSGIQIKIIYTRNQMDSELDRTTADWVVGSIVNHETVVMLSPHIFAEISPHPASDFPLVLTHEIAHSFAWKLFHLQYPRWLSEGLAGLIAGQYKTRTLKLEDAQDFSKLHDTRGWEKTHNYNQAYLFTAFLIEKYNKADLLSLLSQLAPDNDYQTFSNIFKKIYSQDLQSCQTEWINSIYNTYEEPSALARR
ncbi:hypothetical protein M1563_02870 [Patescibacteria group bacterium]|nr:hypothetical protein [Patescibacteria group bacterium]